MTLQEFTHLWNEKRRLLHGDAPGFFKKSFKLIKRKIIKPQVIQYEMINGFPNEVGKIPAVSKPVIDMNEFNRLVCEVWWYFFDVKGKRVESEGRYREDLGFRIQSANKGFSDVICGYNGRTYYIETKQRTEKHLPSQKKFAAWVRDFGGTYISVRSFEDIWEACELIRDGKSLAKFEKIKIK